MTTRKDALTHVPVPLGYDPGYPDRLDEDERRELMEGGLSRRVHRVVLAAMGTAALGGVAGGQTPDDRETKVLDVLRDVTKKGGGAGHWYWDASFPRQKSRSAHGKQPIPRIPISYGNSYCGVFDVSVAREYAARVFRAYGFDVATEVAIDQADARGVLDGFDKKRKVGWVLRGRTKGQGMSTQVVPEEDVSHLDDGELAALKKDGYQIHVAELGNYKVMDGDKFVPVLGYVAGIVEFLNAATPGQDVDLGAMLSGWMQALPIRPQDGTKLPRGMKITRPDERTTTLVAASAGTVVLDFNAKDSPAPRLKSRGRFGGGWEELERPLPTAGRPTLLTMPLGTQWDLAELIKANKAKRPNYRLTQTLPGLPKIRIERRGLTMFLPSHFDASKPFRIEIDLPAGRFTWHGQAVIATLPE